MLLLQPALKEYLWGGRTLIADYNKRGGPETVAESWELSTCLDGLTRIAGGPSAGRTLLQYLAERPESAGAGVAHNGALPVLVKLIDAQKPLSIQVHPDDAYARTTASSAGKTELWYILEAAPGAFLYLGVDRPVSREEFAARIRDNTVEEILRHVPVRPGEAYYIPAGTLHAIGAGIVLAEVQQSSNLTYRVYDYGRLDAAGRPRALHIEQALAVARLSPAASAPPHGGRTRTAADAVRTDIVDCPYFAMHRLDVDGVYPFRTPHATFMHALCISGAAKVFAHDGEIGIHKGDGVFLAAGEAVRMEGKASLLLCGAGGR